MKWDIQIVCISHTDGPFGSYSPMLSLSLFETPRQAFSHWNDLAPRDTRWAEKNDTDVTPSGLLYIFEHTPIFDCFAQCLNELGNMRIKVDGKCDVYYEEKYDTNLELSVDSALEFHGVWFGRLSESDCRAAISCFLDPNDFDYSLTEHGVSMLTPRDME